MSHLPGIITTIAAREETHRRGSLNLNFQQCIKVKPHLGYFLLFMLMKLKNFERIKLKRSNQSTNQQLSIKQGKSKYKLRFIFKTLPSVPQGLFLYVQISYLLSRKKKKVDMSENQSCKIFCIFITYLYHSSSCQTAISLIKCSQLVSAFSALWCKPQAAVQPLASGQWDTCQ